MGELYVSTKQYNLALKYIDSSDVLAKKNKNFEVLIQNAKLYKSVYNTYKNKDKIIFYQNLEQQYKDSLQLFLKNEVTSSTKYIINKTEEEKTIQAKKSNIIILLSFIGFLISCYFIRQQYLKRRKINRIVNIKEAEIEVRSNEIVNLKQKVTASYSEVIELAKKDNPLFISFFKELYPDFYSKLMSVNPELTLTEQKVCFYLKLKFTTKEIADYTFVSIKAIQNRKNRLRKRLFINEGEDIYSWIENL